MPWRYEKIRRFAGLANRRDARDIGDGLSKAQNISLDVGGKIRTIGGLEDFTKTDGSTALTQTAKICPGSGLFRFGSDHWRGTDTVVDLIATSAATDSAVSDQYGEVDDVGGWSTIGGTVTSEADEVDGIDSNGASNDYVLKLVCDGDDTAIARVTPTTVAGQQIFFSADLYCGTASVIYISIVDGGGVTFIYESQHITAAAWTNVTAEFIALSTSVRIDIHVDGSNGTTSYADDVYMINAPRRDLDTNWLALADVATAHVDLYNVNDDSFTADLLDFGTVSSFVGAAAGNVDFPTTSTITDSASTFLSQGVQAGDVRIVSGCSTTAANNIIFVVDRVIAGTVYARGSPFTVTAAEAGTVTLTKYNPVAFHYVNEALRASPVDGGIALRPKHYSFVDRYHLKGAESSEDQYSDWYANDVGPVAPTDIAFDAAVDAGVSGNLAVGEGWEVGMTVTADDGEWAAGTYIIACFFTYDDGQRSALYVPSTDMAMTAITEGASLTLCAKAFAPYDERISGGGVCCRLDETDNPWTLLMDISMAKGARATLSGTYNAWAEGTTANTAYSASFISKRQNIDSYESLAGIDPTTTVETFSGDNAFWNASVIGGNRCFIFAPRYTDAGGNLQQFRDRVMYSQVNAYDTFPIDNIIDVFKGDAEDYVAGGIYGNDLLCFKSRPLYIIDISDPATAGWQMKQDANKGLYPRRGVAHPGAYFETPHGPAWCNEFGVFLYNGSEIVPLLGNKIELSEHPLAYQRYMEFDGTNDYVLKTDDSNLDPGISDWCIECIAKSSTSASDQLVAKSEDGEADQWALQITGAGKLSLYWRIDASDIINTDFGGASIVDGEWHHLLITIDRNGNATGYVDGTAEPTTRDASGSDGLTMDSTSSFSVGAGRQGTTFLFPGSIALVRLWSGLLTSTDATNLYNGAPASSISGKTLKLEWVPKSIDDATWTDTSGNSLDGTVVGATAIYPDDWQSFWTNYSILGHHARTNQLIIMRDCTGKWSSGQDYGDCWIIDLDTMASTTGRRVFTKGIAYSNWATDWKQELIIAEQTSSTSVTIKQWTDEPQSQAVGLIDIRTADIDFGNPAYAKFFDALVAYYKSSAAQTTPISYAIDGDDRFVAWTRITGNFDAEEFWEKLTLEPTAFECDTIRFKLDNPTAAGTLEINDLTLRYQTEEEDID